MGGTHVVDLVQDYGWAVTGDDRRWINEVTVQVRRLLINQLVMYFESYDANC